MMEKNKILQLLKEEGYPEFMLEKTFTKITNFQPETAKAFDRWLNGGRFPDIAVEGYDYEFLTTKMRMQPVGAFITLDWLLREPEKASSALKQGVK